MRDLIVATILAAVTLWAAAGLAGVAARRDAAASGLAGAVRPGR